MELFTATLLATCCHALTICSLRKIFERGDELGYVIFGDASQFADLDAAELASSEQVVDLVAADV